MILCESNVHFLVILSAQYTHFSHHFDLIERILKSLQQIRACILGVFNLRRLRLVALALFAGNAFEIFHLGGSNGCANEAQLVELRNIVARLIVLDEQLNVLDALEFHVSQIHRFTAQCLGIQTKNNR